MFAFNVIHNKSLLMLEQPELVFLTHCYSNIMVFYTHAVENFQNTPYCRKMRRMFVKVPIATI